MKKTFLPLLLALAFSATIFISCETTAVLSDTLMGISEIAALTGDKKLSKYLEAGAKTTRALEDISPVEEYYIGRAVAATVLSNYDIYENKSKEKYANKVCKVITLNSENPDCYNGYHVKLLDSDEINAFATSSGIIFITNGLFNQVSSEDQLAAIIAHEVGHILLKHSTSAIKGSRWAEATAATTNAVLVSVTDDDSRELSDLMGQMVDDISTQLVKTGYSKNQEFDADTKALSLLADAGYNPRALIEVLEILDSIGGKKGTGMFKTHPSPRSRIKNIEFEIDYVNCPNDTTEFRTARFVY